RSGARGRRRQRHIVRDAAEIRQPQLLLDLILAKQAPVEIDHQRDQQGRQDQRGEQGRRRDQDGLGRLRHVGGGCELNRRRVARGRRGQQRELRLQRGYGLVDIGQIGGID